MITYPTGITINAKGDVYVVAGTVKKYSGNIEYPLTKPPVQSVTPCETPIKASPDRMDNILISCENEIATVSYTHLTLPTKA